MTEITETLKAPGTRLDLSSLRLNINYGQNAPVKKMILTVPVKKPGKSTFFRVRAGEEWVFPARILERKEEKEYYIVTEEVEQSLVGLVRPTMLYTAVDRQGNSFLIPVPLPGLDGRRNAWHESLLMALAKAETCWCRISANMSGGAYDLFVAQKPLEEPSWPDLTLDQLVEIAFRGKIIADGNHPQIQSLMGAA